MIVIEAVIINQRKTFTLYGFSKLHDQNMSYSETMFELLDQVWEEVKNNNLQHAGINHVVYDADHMMFAGIELITPLAQDSLLEKKVVILEKYAYGKHIGPYSELDKTYQKVQSVIKHSNEEQQSPSIEIYGHWNDDELKLETEIIHNLI